jgi:hypothetical protein
MNKIIMPVTLGVSTPIWVSDRECHHDVKQQGIVINKVWCYKCEYWVVPPVPYCELIK